MLFRSDYVLDFLIQLDMIITSLDISLDVIIPLGVAIISLVIMQDNLILQETITVL